MLLTLIAAALVCGQRSGCAIGQWVEEHALERMTQLPIPNGPSTLRRTLQAIDVAALETYITHFVHSLDLTIPPTPTAGVWHGQAVDGKAARSANRHGAHVHLVSLVHHGSVRIGT